eukprot:5204177-Amphidinium_carterae.1
MVIASPVVLAAKGLSSTNPHASWKPLQSIIRTKSEHCPAKWPLKAAEYFLLHWPCLWNRKVIGIKGVFTST